MFEFGVHSAFAVDALGAGLLARVLADRHFRVSVDGGHWGRLGGWGRGVDGPVGEQDLAEGCGPVGVAGRRGPGVAAVGVLHIGPAVVADLKGLEEVVGSAFWSEVAGVGGTDGPGSGVVEVAIVGCYSAAGEHAHEVAHLDERGQL